MRAFVNFVIGLKLTESRVDTAKQFLQMSLKMEGEVKDVLVVDGEVTKNALIRAIISENSRIARHNVMNEGKDCQARLDTSVTPRQMEKLAKAAFVMLEPSQSNTPLLHRVNVAAAMLTSTQTVDRSDDTITPTFSQQFIRPLKAIGPNGTVASHKIQKVGNKNNKHPTYTAIVPHLNPLFCADAHLGVTYIVRFYHLNEKFPNFVNYKDYHFRPVLRSDAEPEMKDGVPYYKYMAKSTLADIWKNLFVLVGVMTNSVTHHFRKQVQQELSSQGCMPESIARLAQYVLVGGKLSGKQQSHYITTPPEDAVCGAAGGDPKHKRLFSAVCQGGSCSRNSYLRSAFARIMSNGAAS
jgi:hypothetical protein